MARQAAQEALPLLAASDRHLRLIASFVAGKASDLAGQPNGAAWLEWLGLPAYPTHSPHPA